MSVVFDKKVLDCFSTLGIEPTKNMCIIQRAYRDTVRMVHPDKIRHLGVQWTKEECQTAFDNIRESYIYLKGQFNEIDLPDYDIVYLDEEFDTELKSATQSVSFNLEEFNKQFTASRSVDDYATLGYSEFARQPELSIEDALESLKISRESIAVTENRPKAPGQMMKYLPDALLAAPTIQHSIIGETVDDFTMGNVTDIRVAYENDYETWEETYRSAQKAAPPAKAVDLAAAVEARVREVSMPLRQDELEKIDEKRRLEEDIERNRRRRADLRCLREAQP